MADKGIIFSAAMVRALLDGRKSQTRRLLNPQPKGISHATLNRGHAYGGSWLITGESARCEVDWKAPHYAPGDRLYVREAWRRAGWCPAEYTSFGGDGMVTDIEYLADNALTSFRDPTFDVEKVHCRGMPSIHMPRWASRLWLLVTDVRVQRVAEISEADAIAEGIQADYLEHIHGPDGFRELWNSLHTKPGERWEDNPWIVAVSFEVHHGNIDRSGE